MGCGLGTDTCRPLLRPAGDRPSWVCKGPLPLGIQSFKKKSSGMGDASEADGFTLENMIGIVNSIAIWLPLPKNCQFGPPLKWTPPSELALLQNLTNLPNKSPLKNERTFSMGEKIFPAPTSTCSKTLTNFFLTFWLQITQKIVKDDPALRGVICISCSLNVGGCQNVPSKRRKKSESTSDERAHFYL